MHDRDRGALDRLYCITTAPAHTEDRRAVDDATSVGTSANAEPFGTAGLVSTCGWGSHTCAQATEAFCWDKWAISTSEPSLSIRAPAADLFVGNFVQV